MGPCFPFYTSKPTFFLPCASQRCLSPTALPSFPISTQPRWAHSTSADPKAELPPAPRTPPSVPSTSSPWLCAAARRRRRRVTATAAAIPTRATSAMIPPAKRAALGERCLVFLLASGPMGAGARTATDGLSTPGPDGTNGGRGEVEEGEGEDGEEGGRLGARGGGGT